MRVLPLTNSSKKVLVDDEDFFLCLLRLWHLTAQGYAASQINYKKVPIQNLIMKVEEGFTVDHINGDKLDNRRSNLRPATKSQQSQNRAARSGREFKGVTRQQNGKYRAQIKIEGTTYTLGVFDNPRTAAEQYDFAAIDAFGKFARTNFEW